MHYRFEIWSTSESIENDTDYHSQLPWFEGAFGITESGECLYNFSAYEYDAENEETAFNIGCGMAFRDSWCSGDIIHRMFSYDMSNGWRVVR